MVDRRGKAWKGAIENVVPNDLSNTGDQNPEVISDDEDHEHTVLSELTTSQASQHLDELVEFSIDKNDVTLSRLLSEVINTVENIKISSLQESNIPTFFKKS